MLYWKHRYFVISVWTLITPLSSNIFSWNLAILSQIYIQKQAYFILSGYTQICHFYCTLSRGHFFPGHSQCRYIFFKTPYTSFMLMHVTEWHKHQSKRGTHRTHSKCKTIIPVLGMSSCWYWVISLLSASIFISKEISPTNVHTP